MSLSAGDKMLVTDANASLGLEHLFARDIQRALQYCERAAESLRDRGDSSICGLALYHSSLALTVLGRISEARETAEQAASDELTNAENLLTNALAVFENSGARLRAAWTKADLFSLHRAKGNNTIAETYLESPCTSFKEILLQLTLPTSRS
jgi:tetratricopeptide (TPR) repeat protein